MQINNCLVSAHTIERCKLFLQKPCWRGGFGWKIAHTVWMFSTFPTSSQQKSAVMLSTSSFPQLWAHPQLPRALRDTMYKKLFSCPLTNSYKLHPLTKPFSCCCLFTPNPLRGGTHDPNYERGNETIPFQFRKTGQKPSAILKMFPSRSSAPLAIAIPCYFRLSSSPLDWFSQQHNPRNSDHFQSSSALYFPHKKRTACQAFEREWISVGVRLKVKQMSHILLLFLTSTEVKWWATFVRTNPCSTTLCVNPDLMDKEYFLSCHVVRARSHSAER